MFEGTADTGSKERHVMVVFSAPHDGRLEEYDEWYDDVHLDDVLRTPGFVGAQRFDVADLSDVPAGRYRHLALYEIEGDLDEAVDALVAGRPHRFISPAFDTDATQAWVFTARGPRRVPSPTSD